LGDGGWFKVMPSGVFVRSPETRAKLGKHIRTPEMRAKLSNSLKLAALTRSNWNKGLTKDTDIRLAEHSRRMTGKHHSEETKLKISLSHKSSVKVQQHMKILHKLNTGKPSWNKGLTKDTDSRVRGYAKKGWNHTEESKRKISVSKMGTHHTEESKMKMSISRKGRPSWSKGLTKETDIRVANISKSKMGKMPSGSTWNNGLSKLTDSRLAKMAVLKTITTIGSKNSNWRGGLSFYPYGIGFNKQIKTRVRERDNYTCQYPGCGLMENGTAHDVHHIDYDKNNNQDGNLITLCRHHNGKVNSHRDDWEEYFTHFLLNMEISARV